MGRGLPRPVEWDDLYCELAEAIAAQVDLMVDVARAEACETMAERRQALAFAERHL